MTKEYQVLGFCEKNILFEVEGKTLSFERRLPREDLILYLGIDPEDIKVARDAILVDASTKPLTNSQYTQRLENGNR